MTRDEAAVQVFDVLSDRNPHTLREIADARSLTVAQARNGYHHLRSQLGNEVIVVDKKAHHSTYRLANGAMEVLNYGEHLIKGMRTQVRNLIELTDVAQRNKMFADRRRDSIKKFGGLLDASLIALGLTTDDEKEPKAIVASSRERRVEYPVS